MMTAACFGVTVMTFRSERSKALRACTQAVTSGSTPRTMSIFGGGEGAPPLPPPLAPSGRSMTTPYCFSNFGRYRKLRAVTSGGKSTFRLRTLSSFKSSAFTPLLAATRCTMRRWRLPERAIFASSSFCFSRSSHACFKDSICVWKLLNDSQPSDFESALSRSSNICAFVSSVKVPSSFLQMRSSRICSMILLVFTFFGREIFTPRSVSSTSAMIFSRSLRCSVTSLTTSSPVCLLRSGKASRVLWIFV
mmetsp:Transcript_55022/g.147327  ORF Transcript_55022/g.147327 Transcript_55022/m.147327 type:complete len:249 (-) Transcript_55022:370-1116(-)